MVVTNYREEEYYADDYDHNVIKYIVKDYGLKEEFKKLYNIDFENIDENWTDTKYKEYEKLLYGYKIDFDTFIEWILYPLFNNSKNKYMMFYVTGHHQDFFVIVEMDVEDKEI
jgi:hypothetical protein